MDLLYAQSLINKHRLLLQLQCQKLNENIEHSNAHAIKKAANHKFTIPEYLEPTLCGQILHPLSLRVMRDANVVSNLDNRLQSIHTNENMMNGGLKQFANIGNMRKANSCESHISKKRKLLDSCKSSPTRHDMEPDRSLSIVKSDLDKNSYNSPTIPPSSVGLELYNDNDVLCGRGGGTNVHSGNRYFRTLININRRSYLCARKNDKPEISRSIVRKIRKRKGRFLKKDTASGLWFDIGDNAAREKTSQALRQRASDFRKLILTENNSMDALSLQKSLVPCVTQVNDTPEHSRSLQQDNLIAYHTK